MNFLVSNQSYGGISHPFGKFIQNTDIYVLASYLRCFRINCGWYLSITLHTLVLHGRYVLKPGWGYIPVKRGLSTSGCPFAVAGS